MENSSDQKVSLGCGTLILIAIIVFIFSNRSDSDEADKRLDKIEKQLERIEQLLQKEKR